MTSKTRTAGKIKKERGKGVSQFTDSIRKI